MKTRKGGTVERALGARGLVALRWAAAASAWLLLAGCTTVAQRAASSVVSVASVTPNADIQQTYYLGSFDPASQLPPAVYRIRVSGQSSVLNRTRFASGWYPAGVVDALNGNLSIDNKTGAVSSSGAQDNNSSLEGRGMVMFGPEGMREAPRNHRLVVIMGSSPEQVEQAFASALRSVATVRFGQSGAALDKQLFTRLTELASERDQLKAIRDAR